MTVTARELAATARLVETIAGNLGALRDHVTAERRAVTGWPTRGNAVPGRGGATLTVTEAGAEQLLKIARWNADIEAGLRLLVITAGDVFRSMDELMGLRVPAELRRCSGRVHADCEQPASAHRHPDTGVVIDTLCDSCWLDACRICRLRAPDERRAGRCDACYRRQLRAGRAMSHHVPHDVTRGDDEDA